MEFSLPKYKISNSSPIEDLLVLENIYSELGGFTSTILSEKYFAFSQECVKQLNLIANVLERYKGGTVKIEKEKVPSNEGLDFSSLSIAELYYLYRAWPERHKEREVDGREHMTFYFEGQIVREMKRRKNLTESDQLKVAYCEITYRCELENLSNIFSIPVSISSDSEVATVKFQYCTPSELCALITSHSEYKSIEEREFLIECIDEALDRLQSTSEKTSLLDLVSEISEVRRRKIVKVPSWTLDYLDDAINRATRNFLIPETDLVLPILTLNLQRRSPELVNKAEHIINQCYISALEKDEILEERVNDLHMAVIYCDYVKGFSIQKVGILWNELAAMVISTSSSVSYNIISKMLEMADECENFTNISSEQKEKLKQVLEENIVCEIQNEFKS